MSFLDSLFRRKPADAVERIWHAPPGQRVYAIGDIHGRLDLLNELLRRIDADDAARPPVNTQLIFLGDLIDRGPQSGEVVERVMGLMRVSAQVKCLIGNHEDLLLRCHDGDVRAVPVFENAGGMETMDSYGIVRDQNQPPDADDVIGMIRTHIPADHIAFMRALDDYVVAGDYLFVHAGIRPGVELDKQKPEDMRWIRNKFTDFAGDHGMMIIHGHTITAAVEEKPNRIGIDTGAYHTGRLTAIGLEGAERWFIETGAA